MLDIALLEASGRQESTAAEREEKARVIEIDDYSDSHHSNSYLHQRQTSSQLSPSSGLDSSMAGLSMASVSMQDDLSNDEDSQSDKSFDSNT